MTAMPELHTCKIHWILSVDASDFQPAAGLPAGWQAVVGQSSAAANCLVELAADIDCAQWLRLAAASAWILPL